MGDALHNFVPTEADRVEARRLEALGYRIVSRKYRCASRIDREDWLSVMANSTGCGAPLGDRVLQWSRASAEDHYRRIYSKDTRTVAPGVARCMESSSGAQTTGAGEVFLNVRGRFWVLTQSEVSDLLAVTEDIDPCTHKLREALEAAERDR